MGTNRILYDMSALTFDKASLGNLEYSLQREMLSTDRIGGYMSTTIVCCNTRKYHGLIVAPIDDSDRTYVLLSSLDETIVQHDQSFNLALHRFKGVYEPRGHKYITDFEYTPTPTITYRVGGVILKKEMLWIHKRTQLMIRYTLVDAHSETKLRLRPFLAFRDKRCQRPSAQKGETILSHGFCTLQQRFVRRGQEALAGENAPSIRYAQGILIQQFHGGIVPHALAETITIFSDSPGGIGHGAVVVFHVGRAVGTNG